MTRDFLMKAKELGIATDVDPEPFQKVWKKPKSSWTQM